MDSAENQRVRTPESKGSPGEKSMFVDNENDVDENGSSMNGDSGREDAKNYANSQPNFQLRSEKSDRQSFKKRVRTSFSHKQLTDLEKAFLGNHTPDYRLREDMADSLGLNEKTVRYWFQNRRQRMKEVNKKDEPLKVL